MDDKLAKIASDLDTVVKEMVKNSDLEEKLKHKLNGATETLAREIESKHNAMIEQLDTKISLLEEENVQIKESIEILESEVDANEGGEGKRVIFSIFLMHMLS